MDKWDRRFLELAGFIAQWSKDPSTKVGAVVVDENRMIVSTGYNGLPRNIADSPDRYDDKNEKYKMIVHGEMNALLYAKQRLNGCTLYTYPFAPCSVCASVVVQTGIGRVVAPVFIGNPEHWMHDSIRRSGVTFTEAGIQLDIYPFSLALMVRSE